MGRASTPTPFYSGRVITIAMNSLGQQKGPLVPFFLTNQTVKITARFHVAVLGAVGDTQCKTRELHRPLSSSKNPHSLSKWGQVHNLSCENEFYLNENEKSFPYQSLST